MASCFIFYCATVSLCINAEIIGTVVRFGHFFAIVSINVLIACKVDSIVARGFLAACRYNSDIIYILYFVVVNI